MKKSFIVLISLLGITGMAQTDSTETPERTIELKALFQEAKHLENNATAEDINANRLAIKNAWQDVDPEIAALYKPLASVLNANALVAREIDPQQEQSLSRSPEDWSADLLLRNDFIDGVDMDVTADGNIYIAAFENNVGGGNDSDIFVYRSTNNGNSFDLWKEITASATEILKLQTISMDGNGTKYLLVYLLTDDGILQAARWNMATGNYTYQAIASDVSDFSVDRNYPDNTDAQRVFAVYHRESSNCSAGGTLYSARSTAGSYGFDWVDEKLLTDCVSQPSFAYGTSGACYSVFIRNENLVHKINPDSNDPSSWASNYLVKSGSDFEFNNPTIRAARIDRSSEKVIILSSQRPAGSSDDYFLESYLKESTSNYFYRKERYATGFGDVVFPDSYIKREDGRETITMSYVFMDDRANNDDRNDILLFDGSTFGSFERIARDGLDVWSGFPTAIAETIDGLACAAFAGTSSDGNSGYGLYFNAKSDLMDVEDNSIEGFTFYPNPAQNSLNLSAQTSINTVAIYSLLGQQEMEISPEQKSHSIDVSSLSRGVYVMKVEVDGQRSSYKIIKE